VHQGRRSSRDTGRSRHRPPAQRAAMADEGLTGMAQNFEKSAQYLVGRLFDKQACETIAESYTVRSPERASSLSAAISLMRAHGVELTVEEEKRWASLPEADQIQAIVNRMPQQADDEFQSFFLQLSMLVAAMAHMRTALEAGDAEVVESALASAEDAGVSKYVNPVALTLVGTQAQLVKQQIKDFTAQAKSKASRLVRCQQDFVTAKKKLAIASYKLSRDGADQVKKMVPFVQGFSSSSDRAVLHMTFQGWAFEHDKAKRERLIDELYGERFRECQERLVAWQERVIKGASSSMLRHVKQLNERLVGDVMYSWKKGVDAEKFEREHTETIARLEAKLQRAKTVNIENAQRSLARMFSDSDEKLLELAMRAWANIMQVAYDRRQVAAEAKEMEERMLKRGTTMMESSKRFINAAATGSEVADRICFQAWLQVLNDSKREALLAAELDAKAAGVTSWGERRKATGISATERACRAAEEMQTLRILLAWRVHVQVDLAVRNHQAKVDLKRQQLSGVQNMFRDFASRLETNIGKETARDFMFAPKTSGRLQLSGRLQHSRSQGPPSQKDSRRGRPDQGFLPDINGSRPGSRMGVRKAGITLGS